MSTNPPCQARFDQQAKGQDMLDLTRELLPVQRALDAMALRQRVIGNNIANQNTPNYTRQVVRFEEELRSSSARVQDVTPRVEEDLVAESNVHGNNVSLEREFLDLEKTVLLHEVYTRVLGSQFRKLTNAIRSR
jgi:flagellar basal-body rod protein FlgB